MREEFFKQKWKNLLKKKMDLLIEHKHRTAKKNKKIIRWNLKQQDNQLLDELLGERTIMATSAKKKRK